MKKIEIVFENDEILVINKESGISVQGGVDIAHPLDKELSLQLGYKVFLVHRLDKETAGLMVVAKNQKAASKWIALIAGKSVKKEYTALCFGTPQINGKPAKTGVLTDSVKKGDRELSAITNFEVLSTTKIDKTKQNQDGTTTQIQFETSLLHLTLGTGRMHQIRIHLAKAGAPIVADDKHGDFKLNKQAKKIGLKKLCLAATRLTIPVNGKNKVFEIDVPEYFGVE